MHLSSSILSKPKYRPDIDGLRAIAVLSVVLFHFFPARIPGGFIGVDIFFVISGFLITSIIIENSSRGTFSFSEFYARRIKRIFPAFLIVVISSVSLGWFALYTDHYFRLAKHAMFGLAFVANFTLLHEEGYFGGFPETKPLLHLWSLGIEEQFYLFWPVFCWFFLRKKLNLTTTILSLIVVSFLFNLFVVRIDGVEAFYSPLTRIWELLLGAFLASMTVSRNDAILRIQRDPIASNTTSIVGLLFLTLGFFSITQNTLFPGYWALLPTIGTFLIILAGQNSFFSRYVLSNKIFVFFGLISFPLYLWHWPLYCFLASMEQGYLSRELRVLTLFVSAVLAWLTYRFVERPIRALRSNRIVVPLILISILAFASALIVYDSKGFPERKRVTSSLITEKVREQFNPWPYVQNKTCLSRNKYSESSSLAWWFCIQSKDEPPTILLLGNSKANELYPGFAKNDSFQHHTILSIGACLVGHNPTDIPTTTWHPCHGDRSKRQNQFIRQLVERTPTLQYVMINTLEARLSPKGINMILEEVSFLQKQGIKVVIFLPTVVPNFNPLACYKIPLRGEPRSCHFPNLDRQKILERFEPTRQALLAASKDTLFFDQNVLFCDEDNDNCSYLRDGLPLFRDKGHISEIASMMLQEYFTRWAQLNLPEIFIENLNSANQETEQLTDNHPTFRKTLYQD